MSESPASPTPVRGARRERDGDPRRVAPRLSAPAAGDASGHRRKRRALHRGAARLGAGRRPGGPGRASTAGRASGRRGARPRAAAAGHGFSATFTARAHVARHRRSCAHLRAPGRPGARALPPPDARVGRTRHGTRRPVRSGARAVGAPRDPRRCWPKRSPRRRRPARSPASASASPSGTTSPSIRSRTRSSTTSCSGRPASSPSAARTGAPRSSSPRATSSEPAIADDEEPFHELQRDAKTFSRYVGVRFTGLIIVVPDEALAVPYDRIQRGRLAGSLLIRRSLLPQVLRNGASGAERQSVDRVFDLRTRLQESIRFV